MGQVNQRIDSWLNPNSNTNLENKSDSFNVTNPLTPNGIFPPEVVELILKYLLVEPKSLFDTSISCKLWLQTGSFYLNGFYRYKLEPSTLNLREEIKKQQAIENNLKNGLYWTTVLAKHYWVTHRSTTIFNFDWSISKNLIAINAEKMIRMSMGPEYLYTSGKIIDLGAGRQEEHTDWGTTVIGGVRVTLNRSNWGASTGKVSHFTSTENELQLSSSELTQPDLKIILNYALALDCAESKLKTPRDPNDHYYGLRLPERVIASLKNLDESPTVLLYDRLYGNPEKKNDQNEPTKFSIECYDLLTGKILHEQKISQYGTPIGYFKNYLICSTKTATVFVDLGNNGFQTKFPVGSVTENSFCICDRKICFADGTSVLFFDWTNGRLIRKLNINGLFDESKYREENRQIKIQGVAFDRWKLVLGIGADVNGTEDFHKRLSVGDSVPTFLAVFDIHDNFKLLQSIHVPGSFKGNYPFKIALPPKGSIVVENRTLIEIEFHHPNLGNQVTLAFFNPNKKELDLQVFKIDAIQFSEFVAKKLQCKITEIQAVTYFERDPKVELRDRQRRKMMLDRSKYPTNWKSVRITFFSNANVTSPDAIKFTELGEFKKYYEKLPDVVATLTLTSKSPIIENPTVSRRPQAVCGHCVLVFERFNEETGQWDIIEPFAPKGIDFSKYDFHAGI